MKSFILSVFVLITTLVQSQNATLKGSVVRIEAGSEVPVEFAKVLLLNADSSVFRGTTTDFDGNFTIIGSAGKIIVAFRQSGLQDLYLPIELKAGENPTLRIEMQAPILEMDVVNIVGIRSKTADSDVAEEIKESAGMDTKQTSEQITSKGSGNTEEALTKMSGISSSNSVIYVRGMGDRYNVAYLNGLPVPSPNPELRVIPMDIFPTSIIDVLEVGKMMAPNYYGDFAGGAINIRTKRVFRKPTLNVSVGGGFNTGTTFKEFSTYDGGKTDFLGFDDGTRAIPNAVFNASMENATPIYQQGLYKSDEAKIGTGFANNFNTRNTNAKPATSFQVEGGNYKKFTKAGSGIGFVGMVSHSTNFLIQEGTSRFLNAQNQLTFDFDTKRESFSTSSTGLATISYDLDEKTNIAVNYLFINNSEDQNFQTWGYHRDFGEVKEVYSRRFTYRQNQIHNVQLVGSTKDLMKKRLNLNYGTSYSVTNSVEPDRRQISAQYSDRNDTRHYNLLALDANHTNRFFSNLDENEMAVHIDGDFTFFENKTEETVMSSLKLVVGFDSKIKERQFNFRQFNYLAKGLADSIGDNFDINQPDLYLNDANVENGLLRIEESANPGNGYTAYQEVLGGNIGVRYVINRKIEIIPNIRIENGFQSVVSRNQVQANIIERNIISGVDFMPSIAAKYNVNDYNLIRFGASRTLTRPKFFEVAPFEYLAQIAGMAQIGNPDLINGVNNNFDVRYEIYTPNSSDMLTFGAFGKILETPIEQIMRPSAGGQIISFDNTDGGVVSGLEFEFSKNLSFLAKPSNREASKLQNFSIAGNVAYIYSQITIDDNTGFTTNPKRPLQGASPFMLNVSAKYDKVFKRTNVEQELAKAPIKLMASISYTYSGKSLFAVGTQGVGDQYQFQNNMLNAVVKLNLNRSWALGLRATNLTDNFYRVMQEDAVNRGEWQEINTFRLGRVFSFSATYSL